jgi:iron(III) transport system substrate-binding protein
MRLRHAWLQCLVLLLALPTSAHAQPKTELWVYTSIYKEFADPLSKAFEAKNPDVSVQVFQAGSEKIQAKLEAELIAKKPQADIILTSDPFWGSELERRDLAVARAGRPAAETNYYSLMVLVAHKDLPAAQRPGSFAELTDPRFDRMVQMGSPLESGTTFSTVAYLSEKFGWSYFEKLRKNHVASSGGNSTVIQKVESGERKLGIVLLENALAAQKRGSPIEVIYPSDGSIPIPSVQVVLKTSPRTQVARRFAEFVLSSEGQGLLRNGYMYPVARTVSSPEGARPLSEVTRNSLQWTPERIRSVAAKAKEIKSRFAEIVLE